MSVWTNERHVAWVEGSETGPSPHFFPDNLNIVKDRALIHIRNQRSKR